ncbi:hypothetical protein PssvBMR6_gp08 [Pseudomonas phage MR6]|uniref:Uncharacterized protein n=1 Tax=Pseudomonas phage MR5 TaxID=2711172 RepID=A0A6M3TCN4_9CAUD|nr:hypothetical protein PssvBMR5_gp08 [Pseudomonas phage MR5]QJD54836.1 hypothetical protein PssvBMR6_gp08 [Pseudomonas phage MR6]QJD54895.1 hypothetical protein PssvBMR7_gp08 [Pseudomonas phage MR7]QJD54956.1 hypothetical protein PssvBMR8_gp08 [Pseudomonas phage MR8]QJD55013.1 hypothetical protein PssvBMR12_gp08 [Pseudomonas phage MR12]QJD55316.1 hypothetical protein PssvBMR18_gp08 [Pseudomonas phage MR18]QJF74577.1 hypothetical protein PssvBMR16_gp08 [Pseudomonas phage MR16]
MVCPVCRWNRLNSSCFIVSIQIECLPVRQQR